MARLAAVVADARFTFIVGKGGVGKTTTACALALELADAGIPTHLISTDPAHSLHDVLHAAKPCTSLLAIEEFDATAYAGAWLEHARDAITQLVERGTYLDAADVAAFTDLALPGVDELMAVLRLVDLAGAEARVVVDTAPTGHMLRLLDAGAVHAGVARALRAMADKAAVVASSLAGRSVRLAGEALIDELDGYARRYRDEVLRPAAFIIAARAGSVVEAETQRIAAALAARACGIRATVWTGAVGAGGGGQCMQAPWRAAPPRGCEPLRAWSAALQPCALTAAAPAAETTRADLAGGAALPWLLAQPQQLWLFAGKGGVGKTTCAAAFAIALAEQRAVLLCSVDPAGSLGDVLGARAVLPSRLRTLQLDAPAELQRLSDLYRSEVSEALERFGLAEAAVLDRRVIASLWELAPPGMDEIAALTTMLDAAATEETVIVDSAPTGHLMRLLQMPELALDWVRQLMRLLVKYGAAASGTGAAEALLRLARELRTLRELLHDAARAATIVVTLPEAVVTAETDRLHDWLRARQLPVLATIVNRAPADGTWSARTILAPQRNEPPTGARALREFVAAWKIET